MFSRWKICWREYCDGIRAESYRPHCVSQTEENEKVHLSLIQAYSTGVLHSVEAPGFSLGNLTEDFCLWTFANPLTVIIVKLWSPMQESIVLIHTVGSRRNIQVSCIGLWRSSDVRVYCVTLCRVTWHNFFRWLKCKVVEVFKEITHTSCNWHFSMHFWDYVFLSTDVSVLFL